MHLNAGLVVCSQQQRLVDIYSHSCPNAVDANNDRTNSCPDGHAHHGGSHGLADRYAHHGDSDNGSSHTDTDRYAHHGGSHGLADRHTDDVDSYGLADDGNAVHGNAVPGRSIRRSSASPASYAIAVVVKHFV
jgi:hypothetical protein